MNKFIYALLAAFLLLVPCSHADESATQLKSILLDQFGPYPDDKTVKKIYFHYRPDLVEMFMTKEYDEYSIKIYKVCRFSLEPGGKKFILRYQSGAAGFDPTFEVYKETFEGADVRVYTAMAETARVTGNGFIEFSGHVNSYGYWIRRATVENGQLERVEYPFDYMGLETRSMVELKLYSDQNFKKVVAKIPKGSPITVLLHKKIREKNNFYDHFLIKFEPGLVGWWKPSKDNYEPEEIEGLSQNEIK